MGVLLVGLGRFLVHREKKLLVFGAIVWTLPSIVFWLPYIVPILRHYYLSSIGLVWLAGLLVLSRVKTGRAAATTAALIVISLLVPEAAYHWYNDAHAASTKTPHGAFFYNHEVADARVKQLVELRNSVLNCTRSPDGKKKSIVLCRWDVYANVVYGIASQGTAVTSEPQGAILPEIGYAHYVSEKADVQLIRYVYMENDDVRRAVSGLLVSARQEGDCVFVPASIRPFDELQDGVTYYR
jgi:hypothetical protein